MPSSAAPWDPPALALSLLSATSLLCKLSPASLSLRRNCLHRDLLALSFIPPEVFSFPLHLPVPGKELCGKTGLGTEPRQPWAWGTRRGMQEGGEEGGCPDSHLLSLISALHGVTATRFSPYPQTTHIYNYCLPFKKGTTSFTLKSSKHFRLKSLSGILHFYKHNRTLVHAFCQQRFD